MNSPEPDRPRARTVVSVRSPADLVAAVPYLVGFGPTRCVVLVSLRGPRLRCGLVARADLPGLAGSPVDVTAWASSLVPSVLRDEPREVVALVYDEQPWLPDDPPLRGVVDALRRSFGDAGVPLREAVYVGAERFWSYTCSRPACCPAQGVPVASGRSSEVATAYVLKGRAPLPDRAALERTVAPAGPLVLAATIAACDTALTASSLSWQREGETAWRRWQEGTVTLFGQLARCVLSAGDLPSVDDTGRLLAGLLDRTTRDLLAIRWTRWIEALPAAEAGSPPGQEVLDALDVRCPHEPDGRLAEVDGSEALMRLLTCLAARAQDDLALAPLALVAMHAWSSGEGALAGVAVDRALTIDPDYRMAVLLDQLLRSGLPPAWAAADRAQDECA